MAKPCPERMVVVPRPPRKQAQERVMRCLIDAQLPRRWRIGLRVRGTTRGTNP